MSVQHDDTHAAAGSPRGVPSHAPPVVRTQGSAHRGCRCHLVLLPSPVGDVVLLRVAGDIDVTTTAAVRTILENAVSVRPDTLVVDVSAVVFCGAHGLSLFIDSAAEAADHGVRFVMSGASGQARRLWTLLWPTAQIPDQYPSARTAVLFAMARSTDRCNRARPPDQARSRLVPAPRAAPDTGSPSIEGPAP